jgi:hypothetical protein
MKHLVLLTISHHPERAREKVAHNDLIQEVISSNKKKLPTELTNINDSFIIIATYNWPQPLFSKKVLKTNLFYLMKS